MSLPVNATRQFTPDLRICRILNGMWQVSGAHGRIDPQAAIRNMFDYHDQGFTTWDLADHYGPAEDFIGEFRRQLSASRGEAALAGMQALTKWVPRPGPMTRKIVEDNINISLRRMATKTLDLLQFHWWEYKDARYLDALSALSELRDEGKIRHVALTNFDTERLRIMTDKGIRVVSNQVQYSLIDRRPEVQMVKFCQEHNIWLLPYGTVCGGLLSERYLGQPEPSYYRLNTASLQKYKDMVDSWGGWELFQELLRVLKQIADQRHVSIANVATRYILDRPMVAGVIIGARLGVSDNRADTARVFDLTLTPDDRQRIETVLAKSRDLFKAIGDCGDEYR
jgi:aryl-alcohol dehydrogenase-like predicted oxidoreductase